MHEAVTEGFYWTDEKVEGLISLGIALVSHVEWPWIALTTQFRLITASPYFSHSKQWLFVSGSDSFEAHNLEYISDRRNSIYAAVHPVSCLHLCDTCMPTCGC